MDRVGKNQHALGDCLDQVLKSAAIVNVGCVHIPTDDQAEMIQQQTQLATDNPSLVREAFLASLLCAGSFTSRMNQFDTVTINDTNQAGVSHELLYPEAMGVKPTKQPSPVRQAEKEMQPVVFQPAIEGPLATPFEDKE